MHKGTGLVALLLLGLVMSGCSGSSTIVGKWEGADESLTLIAYDFRNDGTFTVTVAGVPVEGTYEIVDSNTIRMTISVLGVQQSTDVDFTRDGDALTLNLEGSPQIFHKVR